MRNKCIYRTITVHFLALCTLFTALVVGCEKKSTPEKPIKSDRLVVFIGSSANAQQWEAIGGGAKKAAKQSGLARVKFLETYPYNPQTADQFVNDAILHKPDAIAVWTLDGGVEANTLKKIRNAGIKLITVGNRVDGFYDVPHVQIDYLAASRTLASNIKEALAGQRSYALLHNQGHSESADACLHAFNREVDLIGQSKPIISRSMHDTDKTPTQLVQLMFSEFRHTGLIVTLGHEPWLTSSPYDIIPEKAHFAAISTVPSLLEYLRQGKATMLVGPLDGEIGSKTVTLAIEALLAEEAFTGSASIECEVVTRDNCDDFAARYDEAAGKTTRSPETTSR